MPCGSNSDFMYPLEADVYYPVVEQQAYGGVQKTWILDRTIACSFAPAGTAWGEEVKPNVNITQNSALFGRVREDIRKSSRDSSNSMVNVIITNIRDRNCNPVYLETAGVRSGKSTIFELATNEPIVGPFGNVEYYKLVIRRSENQAADV